MKLICKPLLCGIISTIISSPSYVLANESSRFDLKVLKVLTQGSPGSAFILGPDKESSCVLITASHVVKINNDKEPLTFASPKGFKFDISPGKFIFSSPELDLAITKAPSCQNSMDLPLARASSIVTSTKVWVKGYPESIGDSLLPKTVSGRITQYNDIEGYDLNYDAPTSVGFSGGPVINSDGTELLALHGYSDTVGDINDLSRREEMRVGGRGVSAPLLYRFLRMNGFKMFRSKKSVCLVGVC